MESATLHNEQEVRRLQLRIGGYVKIKRSGDVIPKVIGAAPTPATKAIEEEEDVVEVPPLEDYTLPATCPACGTATVREEERVLVRCPASYTCPAQIIEKLA